MLILQCVNIIIIMRIIMWKIHSRVVTGILFQRMDTEYEKTPRYVIHTLRNGKLKCKKQKNRQPTFCSYSNKNSKYSIWKIDLVTGFQNYGSWEVRTSTNVWLFKLWSIITTTAEICKMIGQGPVCPCDDDVTCRSWLAALVAMIDTTLNPIFGLVDVWTC